MVASAGIRTSDLLITGQSALQLIAPPHRTGIWMVLDNSSKSRVVQQYMSAGVPIIVGFVMMEQCVNGWRRFACYSHVCVQGTPQNVIRKC